MTRILAKILTIIFVKGGTHLLNPKKPTTVELIVSAIIMIILAVIIKLS